MKTGLDILLGSDKITKLTDKTITNEGYLLVDIKKIRPNLSQPRKNFDKDQLEQLSLSIKKQGLIMPILIRKDKSVDGQYIIIAGEIR